MCNYEYKPTAGSTKHQEVCTVCGTAKPNSAEEEHTWVKDNDTSALCTDCYEAVDLNCTNDSITIKEGYWIPAPVTVTPDSYSSELKATTENSDIVVLSKNHFATTGEVVGLNAGSALVTYTLKLSDDVILEKNPKREPHSLFFLRQPAPVFWRFSQSA